PFDPASEAGHLIINTADYVTQLLAPILSEICAREAPHVVLEFTWTGTRTAEGLAGIDFMIRPRAFGERLGTTEGAGSVVRRGEVGGLAPVAARRDGLHRLRRQRGAAAAPDAWAIPGLTLRRIPTRPERLSRGADVASADIPPRDIAGLYGARFPRARGDRREV